MESDGRWCPAHRHRPGVPTPQGFGAVAAIERDDRTTISVRVPRCLPDGRGNKTRRTVQPAAAGRIDESARKMPGAQVETNVQRGLHLDCVAITA